MRIERLTHNEALRALRRDNYVDSLPRRSSLCLATRLLPQVFTSMRRVLQQIGPSSVRVHQRRRFLNFLAVISRLSDAAKLQRCRLCSATRSLPQNEHLYAPTPATNRPFKRSRSPTTTFSQFSRRYLKIEQRRKAAALPFVFGNALASSK